MSLKQAIIDFLAKSDKVPNFRLGGTVLMQDDGEGPYIAYWDPSLGPLPTIGGGFDPNHLRRVRNGRLVTGPELHEEQLEAKRQEEEATATRARTFET